MRITHTIVASAAGVWIAAGALGTAQEPTFRGANRTVPVYATVTDQNGRLVPDLARDAFSIQDNGKPQTVTLFANEIQPITVVILLDRSTSMRANFGLVQKAAEKFVEVMGPADKARIGSFSDRVEVDPRDFTSDHETLLTILRTDLQEGGPTPLWNAVNVGITALLHEEGRRVILVFTDGVDAPFKPQPEGLWRICKAWGVAPSEVLMLGDYVYDIQVGRNAGARTALLTHGREWPFAAEAEFARIRIHARDHVICRAAHEHEAIRLRHDARRDSGIARDAILFGVREPRVDELRILLVRIEVAAGRRVEHEQIAAPVKVPLAMQVVRERAGVAAVAVQRESRAARIDPRPHREDVARFSQIAEQPLALLRELAHGVDELVDRGGRRISRFLALLVHSVAAEERRRAGQREAVADAPDSSPSAIVYHSVRMRIHVLEQLVHHVPRKDVVVNHHLFVGECEPRHLGAYGKPILVLP